MGEILLQIHNTHVKVTAFGETSSDPFLDDSPMEVVENVMKRMRSIYGDIEFNIVTIEDV